MADETYRPRKVVPTSNFEAEWEEEIPKKGTPLPKKSGKDLLAEVHAVRKQSAKEHGEEPPSFEGVAVSGNVPPEFEVAMSQTRQGESQMTPTKRNREEGNPRPRRKSISNEGTLKTNSQVKEILDKVKKFVDFNYDEIKLPSLGKFYDGSDGPLDGILHVRPMTGKEEEILATARWVKSGKAMDMIFDKCIQEDYDPVNFLSIDRTYLLIFLRGISYTPEYEVEIKCPDCSTKYSSVIHLNEIPVDECPLNFGPDKLTDVLPTTKLNFKYRLSTGRDENEVSKYRERKAKWFGDRGNDDTLLFRISSLIEYIEDVEHQKDIQLILEKLPVSDVNYIRNMVNEPPFGVDTKIPETCVSCMSEFDIDLPLEANFFFPRRVKEES